MATDVVMGSHFFVSLAPAVFRDITFGYLCVFIYYIFYIVDIICTMANLSFTESSHRGDTGSGYWQIQLDRDLVDTIAAIYPEWVKGGTANSMAEGGPPCAGKPRAATSPPKAVVDSSPLANTMEQNKQCKCIYIHIPSLYIIKLYVKYSE